MIFIRDEINEHFTDLKIVQRQITNYIKRYRKDIDDEKDPSRMLNLDETLDLIAAYQSTLQNILEMQKVPFDILIVIEKEK